MGRALATSPPARPPPLQPPLKHLLPAMRCFFMIKASPLDTVLSFQNFLWRRVDTCLIHCRCVIMTSSYHRFFCKVWIPAFTAVFTKMLAHGSTELFDTTDAKTAWAKKYICIAISIFYPLFQKIHILNQICLFYITWMSGALIFGRKDCSFVLKTCHVGYHSISWTAIVMLHLWEELS